MRSISSLSIVLQVLFYSQLYIPSAIYLYPSPLIQLISENFIASTTSPSPPASIHSRRGGERGGASRSPSASVIWFYTASFPLFYTKVIYTLSYLVTVVLYGYIHTYKSHPPRPPRPTALLDARATTSEASMFPHVIDSTYTPPRNRHADISKSSAASAARCDDIPRGGRVRTVMGVGGDRSQR